MRHARPTATIAKAAVAILLVGALHLGVLPAPVHAAAPAYVGTWSADPAKCKVPQEIQGAPMVLRRTGYDQHEAHCTFKSLRRSGAAWWVSAQCLVEGSKQRDSFTLRVKGDTLTMTRGSSKHTLRRCK